MENCTSGLSTTTTMAQNVQASNAAHSSSPQAANSSSNLAGPSLINPLSVHSESGSPMVGPLSTPKVAISPLSGQRSCAKEIPLIHHHSSLRGAPLDNQPQNPFAPMDGDARNPFPLNNALTKQPQSFSIPGAVSASSTNPPPQPISAVSASSTNPPPHPSDVIVRTLFPEPDDTKEEAQTLFESLNGQKNPNKVVVLAFTSTQSKDPFDEQITRQHYLEAHDLDDEDLPTQIPAHFTKNRVLALAISDGTKQWTPLSKGKEDWPDDLDDTTISLQQGYYGAYVRRCTLEGALGSIIKKAKKKWPGAYKRKSRRSVSDTSLEASDVKRLEEGCSNSSLQVLKAKSLVSFQVSLAFNSKFILTI